MKDIGLQRVRYNLATEQHHQKSFKIKHIVTSNCLKFKPRVSQFLSSKKKIILMLKIIRKQFSKILFSKFLELFRKKVNCFFKSVIYIYRHTFTHTHTHTHTYMGFSGGSDSKESACDTGDLGLIPGLGNSCWRWAW